MKTALTLTAGRALFVLVVLALAPGCSDAGRAPTWAYISPVIIQPNCATGSCHSPAAAAAGLDFSTPDSGYASLTRLWIWVNDPSMSGQPGCGNAAGTVVCEKQYRPLVTPFDPSESRLVSVLRGRNAPLMPPNRPLDEADIQLIETWILNGAQKESRRVRMRADAAPLDAPREAAPSGADAPSSDAADARDASAGDGASDGTNGVEASHG